MKKIIVNTHKRYFNNEINAIDCFILLRDKYHINDLFLLESLSGPKKDCTMSAIGVEKLITVFLKTNHVNLIIHDEKIKHLLINFPTKKKIKNINDFFIFIRNIESMFSFDTIHSIAGIGWFGNFSYDSIFYFEDIEKFIPNNNESVISLSIYKHIAVFDLQKKEKILYTHGFNENKIKTSQDNKNIFRIFTKIKNKQETNNNKITHTTQMTVTKKEYFEWFKKVKSHIDVGDIYQIQLGYDVKIHSNIDAFTVYLNMRKNNPSPYMYFFGIDREKIVIGSSPELFLNISKDDEIIMRPIAGTIPNNNNKLIKEKNKKILLNNPKELSEHLMLVDLCRNDIAKCCIPDTLECDELIITEEYSHVIHLVSNVKGKRLNNIDKFNIIAATFPAGTMTGTPKIKAMQIIESIEKTSRGLYGGAIGYIGFSGEVITALCIRTAVLEKNIYTIRASAGIVQDSTAIGEWNETISKLSSTYLAITGQELKNENFIN